MRQRIEQFVCDSCNGSTDVPLERGMDTPPLPLGWVAVLVKGEGEGRIYCSKRCAIAALADVPGVDNSLVLAKINWGKK